MHFNSKKRFRSLSLFVLSQILRLFCTSMQQSICIILRLFCTSMQKSICIILRLFCTSMQKSICIILRLGTKFMVPYLLLISDIHMYKSIRLSILFRSKKIITYDLRTYFSPWLPCSTFKMIILDRTITQPYMAISI